MRLIKRAKNDHLLLLVLHQMICDGWSISLLLRELGKLYSAFVKKSDRGSRRAEDNLQPICRAAKKFAARRAIAKSTRVLEETVAWQRRRASAARAIMRGRRRRLFAARAFRSRFLQAGPDVAAARRRSRVRPFCVTLMAAFNVLLSRYSNQEDIPVGFPVANRRHADTEDLIGAFVNTLVLRTDLSGKPTFRELLRRVRSHCQDALAQQDLPFEKLVEELQRERDLSRNPLFQVMFAYQNHPAAEFKIPGVRAETVELSRCDGEIRI